MPAFQHQDGVAGGEQVDQAGLPGRVAGAGVEEDLLLRLQDTLQPSMQAQ